MVGRRMFLFGVNVRSSNAFNVALYASFGVSPLTKRSFVSLTLYILFLTRFNAGGANLRRQAAHKLDPAPLEPVPRVPGGLHGGGRSRRLLQQRHRGECGGSWCQHGLSSGGMYLRTAVPCKQRHRGVMVAICRRARNLCVSQANCSKYIASYSSVYSRAGA